MRIHFLRNATLIVHAGDHRILVDPMLCDAGAIISLAFLRHPSRRNPTVPLPDGAPAALESVDTALITHCRRGHFDHLDVRGARWLARRSIPTYCSRLDDAHLRRRGIATVPLRPGERAPFLGGHVTPVPTTHGRGLVGRLMGPGVGYFIELPGEPSLYLSGDTVLTDTERRVLTELRPDVAVVAAGGAVFDVGGPVLMDLDEVLEFVRLAPGTVVATHLEAINHCPTTRDELRTAADRAGLSAKLRVPGDGEVLELSA